MHDMEQRSRARSAMLALVGAIAAALIGNSALAAECKHKVREQQAGGSALHITNATSANLDVTFYRTSVDPAKQAASATVAPGGLAHVTLNMGGEKTDLTVIAVIAAQGGYPEMTCSVRTFNSVKSQLTEDVHTTWDASTCTASKGATKAYVSSCEKSFQPDNHSRWKTTWKFAD